MLGGGNPNSSTDDHIPAGSNNVLISFDHALNEHFEKIEINNNVFTSNSFKISVLDKAEPIEEEFGIGLDLSIGGEWIAEQLQIIGKFNVALKSR